MIRSLVVCLILALGAPAGAQDRMPPIPPDKMTDAQKKAVAQYDADRDEIIKTWGSSYNRPIPKGVHGPVVPLLRSPEVMLRAEAFGDYLQFKTVLPPKLRDFVMLITARQWTQQYVWNSHYATTIKLGMSPDIVNALAEGRRPSGMSDEEAIVYDFCDELYRNHSVSDATYTRALARFGEQGIIDLVSVNAFYTFFSMVMNVARTPLPEGASAGPLPALPQ
jgi:4-carboxymuconolactone decarboxylase